MAGKAWTRGEDKRLRQMAPRLGSAAVAQALGRSQHGVRHRARLLGIDFRKCGEAHWGARHSEAFVEFARHLHEAGHSPSAIRDRLGLRKGTADSILYFRHRLEK